MSMIYHNTYIYIYIYTCMYTYCVHIYIYIYIGPRVQLKRPAAHLARARSDHPSIILYYIALTHVT